jgi:glycosyltransferase involved in cell wall biosynthesis
MAADAPAQRTSPRALRAAVKDHMRIKAQRARVRAEYCGLKAFDLVLVNSLFSRESVLRSHGLESTVCYLGIDTERFRPLDLPREEFVLGLGTFGSTKGPDRAIEALATIPLQIRPPLVWIANTVHAEYLDEMRRLAAHRGVELTCRELVSDDALLEALNRASALLYASRLEPFGYAPLEANACGTPVVAIAEGGIRETIQHGCNGLLVDGNDPAALGAAVSSLLASGPLRKQMGQRARETVVDRWGVAGSIDRLEAALEGLLTRSASAPHGAAAPATA